MPIKLTKKDIENCLFLTVNSRLSRHLLQTLDNQYAKDQTAWETPTILPLSVWLTQQFHLTNITGKILLSDFQEHCLWEKIIQDSDIAPHLLQPSQTAQLIKQAWRFLIEWEVPLHELMHYDTQLEAECLRLWINQFQTICKVNNWITTAELPALLTSIDQTSPLPLPKEIRLTGFDDFPPSTQTLLNQLRTHTDIESFEINIPHATCQKVTLADTEAELISMANWAKAHWESDSTQQIACVVPDLQTQQSLVRRIFTQVFCLENILPSTKKTIAPFNLSAGQSFDQHDMIKTALYMLQWSVQPISIQDVSYLLQSPYLCQNESEASMGASIDAKLRAHQQLTIHPKDLFEVIATLQPRYPNASWLARWRQWLTVTGNQHQPLLPSEWVKHFIAILKALKWPGQHTQDSVTFQYLERFKKLLETFSQLDLIYKTISFNKALKLFITLTKQTVYQPKSHNEPIQIMGILEASGLSFDAIWVMGLHNGVWPPPAKPNPFIPFSIQQKYQLPHATAARELHFCQQVINRLKKSAQQVVFSIPSTQDDQHLQPTQLLNDVPEIAQTTLNEGSDELPKHLWKTEPLETLADNMAPPISNPSAIRGGAHILKLQALCPFKAFASIRLNANALTSPQLGLDSATRGILAHQVLYFFWETILDQTQLNQLSEEALLNHIDQAIEKATLDFKTQEIKQNGYYFWMVEKKRLKSVLLNWIQLEKNRPYFRVTQRETPTQITIAQLPLKLRIDRVDQLADGSYLLIDYKTGEVNIKHWFEERLSDPQLPIYAAFTQTSDNNYYAGLAFAQVRSYKPSFQGIVSETHLYATTPTTGFTPIHHSKNALEIVHWHGLQQHWQMTLTQLANDFCQGVAVVDPMTPIACQHCDLQPLCRINTASTESEIGLEGANT